MQSFSREENIQGPDLKGALQFYRAHLSRMINSFFVSKSVTCLLSVPKGSQWMFAKGVYGCGLKKCN